MVKSPQKKNILKPILMILLILLPAVYFGISYYIANTLTTSKPNPATDSPTFVASDVTDATFSTPDGIQLHG